MTSERQPLRLSAIEADRTYTASEFAEVFEVHPSTIIRWRKTYRLPRTRNRSYLGATILKFAGRGAKRLTITDAEFARRSNAAAERVKEMV